VLRMILFILTNLLIMLTVGLVLAGLGLWFEVSFVSSDLQSVGALFLFSFVIGCTGSLISLACSRMIAKQAMNVRVLQPASGLSAAEQRVLAKVHERSRQAGLLHMPEVGIYDSPEVNAFATGPTKKRSLVALSSGLLARLDERAVDAVIAHEVAHIVNGDMVTMTLLQGVINTFVVFFSRLIAIVISRGRRNAGQWVYVFTSFILQLVFSILGALIVAYFSRQREFRADAQAAQWVGRADMAHALRSLMPVAEAVDQAHKSVAVLKISGRAAWLALFSTHPPLAERIRRLENEG
jgi:heat shock protein HtpX